MAPGGYTWWYLDALSDDGAHGLTVIAFLGSVFSPYYAWARRRAGAAPVDALDHCALNVALYGRGGKHWSMTERGRGQVRRDRHTLRIGPSGLHWDGRALSIEIDEITVPWPSRLQGTLSLTPAALCSPEYTLDAHGRHRWRPIAPSARVEVEMRRPGLRWRGAGYFDMNRGDEPLEAAFQRWDWSRAHLPGGRAAVFYDVERRHGERHALALHFDPDGAATSFAAPPSAALPRTGWRLARVTRSDLDCAPRVAATLEDAPFYARSLVDAQWHGERVRAVHESLSLSRFDSAWTRFMLPFRMPRFAGSPL